jgi:hypothetical protein
VQSPDGATNKVMVDHTTTAGGLCELLMKKRNVPLITKWLIVEHLPELFMGMNSRLLLMMKKKPFLLLPSLVDNFNWVSSIYAILRATPEHPYAFLIFDILFEICLSCWE